MNLKSIKSIKEIDMNQSTTSTDIYESIFYVIGNTTLYKSNIDILHKEEYINSKMWCGGASDWHGGCRLDVKIPTSLFLKQPHQLFVENGIFNL